MTESRLGISNKGVTGSNLFLENNSDCCVERGPQTKAERCVIRLLKRSRETPTVTVVKDGRNVHIQGTFPKYRRQDLLMGWMV